MPKSKRWPSVGLVVLNWENYSDTAECLSSIDTLDYPNYECFVVDNGSTDDSGERIDEEFDWVEVIYNERNLGAAAGNNPGIQRALEAGFDYVLCLNEDTILPSNFLFPLVRTMESEDRVAAVGGREFNPETGEVVSEGSWFFTILGGRIRNADCSPTDGLCGSRILPPEIGFRYVPSSMLLLNPAFVESYDVFCEEYFLGMEDVDLAFQAYRNDWKVLVNPEARIYHKEGRTMEWTPFKSYHWVRNRLTFAALRLPPHIRFLFLLMLALTLAWFCIRWHLRGRTDIVRAVLVGIGDAIDDADVREYEFFAE